MDDSAHDNQLYLHFTNAFAFMFSFAETAAAIHFNWMPEKKDTHARQEKKQ